MIDEKEVMAYVRMPACFMQGCSEDIVIFRADGETILPITGYMRGCFFSLTEKSVLRKEAFPVTSILPEMNDLSTRFRTRVLQDTGILED